MKKVSLLLIIIMCINGYTKAQAPSQFNVTTKVIAEPTPVISPLASMVKVTGHKKLLANDTTETAELGHDSVATGISQINLVFSFQLADTNNVAEIYLKAGHTNEGDEIYKGSFIYNNEDSRNTGGALHRVENTVTVEVTANMITAKTKYYEIYTKDKQGLSSDIIKYSE